MVYDLYYWFYLINIYISFILMEYLTISGDPVTKFKIIGEGNFSQVFFA